MTSSRKERKRRESNSGVTELSRGRIISLRASYKAHLADLSSVIPAHASPGGREGGTNIYARDLRGAMCVCDIPGYV